MIVECYSVLYAADSPTLKVFITSKKVKFASLEFDEA